MINCNYPWKWGRGGGAGFKLVMILHDGYEYFPQQHGSGTHYLHMIKIPCTKQDSTFFAAIWVDLMQF